MVCIWKTFRLELPQTSWCCSLTNVEAENSDKLNFRDVDRQQHLVYFHPSELYFNRIIIKNLVIKQYSLNVERWNDFFWTFPKVSFRSIFLHYWDLFSSFQLWQRISGGRFSIQNGSIKSQGPVQSLAEAGSERTIGKKVEEKRRTTEWRQTSAGRKALPCPWNPGLSARRSRFDNKYVRLYETIVHRVRNRLYMLHRRKHKRENKKPLNAVSICPIERDIDSSKRKRLIKVSMKRNKK